MREFSLYSWDENSPGRDVPLKQNDHAMDEIRYFAAAISKERKRESLGAVWVERK